MSKIRNPKELVSTLRRVAELTGGAGSELAAKSSGICSALSDSAASPDRRPLTDFDAALDFIGYNGDEAWPFAGEPCSNVYDWSVRPLFCLLLADIIESEFL